MTGVILLHILTGLTAGALLGHIYFRLLAGSVKALIEGAPARRIVMFYAGRIGLAVIVFWLLAHLGVAALAAGLAGLLAVRLRLTCGRDAAA